jgi:hypothetical protein
LDLKDWHAQWKVLATKKKGTKPKEPTKVGTSKKTSNPTDNTRKVVEHGQSSGSITTR